MTTFAAAATNQGANMSRFPQKCALCGKKRKTEHHDNRQVCRSCRNLTTAIRNAPQVVKTLWRELQDEPILLEQDSRVITSDIELPDVLEGTRYRTMDRDRNTWYLSVSELEGNPVEIFASTAFDRDHELQNRISNLTTITRLISLLLRHLFLNERLTFDKMLKQIQRSSRQENDLPDMLFRVLSRYNVSAASQR
ncbi:MAG: hypothetical protein CSA34_01610 [Desulfobulbus propionicus]|nr:MAG: hypothetical protein CSA34_01610 [Desulfobulbus propionicus]